MKKFLIGFIVFSLVLFIFPAVAYAGPGVELGTTGDGTAEWTTEEVKAGSYSVKLTMPAGTGWVNDNAEVQIDVSGQNLTFSEISDWSFWTLTPTGYESYALPIEFYADIDDDGVADKIIRGNILKKSVPVTNEWYEITPELWKNYGGAFYVWRGDGTGFDFYVGSDPWAKAVRTWGDATLLRVDLSYGSLGSNNAVTAYGDDFTLNGITYAVEPQPPSPPAAPAGPAGFVQQTVGVGTHTVDASAEAGASATITGSGGQTVTIEGISSAAASAGGFSIEGATTYVDLHLDSSEGVEQIQFTILGGAGVPRWWNGSSWIECSDYTIDAAGNVTTTITNSTTPSLSDLTGTVFTVVPGPVRTHEMTCWQIYVNEEGNFEFIFWWEYANNNWVSIYDSQGNLVYRESFPYGEPIVEVNLPDGMYTVKTFHEEGNILQEFVIGK